MSTCRWNGTGQPRLRNDHHLRDCHLSGCPGCEPCQPTYGHCRCGWHLDADHARTCDRCLGYTRDDLRTILQLCRALPAEAEYRGVNSEAAMLCGPAANPRDWQHQAIAAMLGRANDAYLADCRDELHPLWVLGTWDIAWREALNHPTTEPLDIASAGHYLDTQLTYMAQREEPDWDQFAKEIRDCRAHHEDVLREGVRPDTGVPCPMCGDGALVKDWAEQQSKRCDCGPRPRLRHAEHGQCTCRFAIRLEPQPDGNLHPVRIYADPFPDPHLHHHPDVDCIACHREAEWRAQHASHVADDEAADRWRCPRCNTWYTDEDYRAKVDGVYMLKAPALTASQIATTYRVKEATVRKWAQRGKVRKRGTDADGRMLYDVADVLAAREVDESECA